MLNYLIVADRYISFHNIHHFVTLRVLVYHDCKVSQVFVTSFGVHSTFSSCK